MKVYFVRHGESAGNLLEENLEKEFSWEDFDQLSELGWKQGRKLGKRIKGEDLTHIVVSKLQRAQETAEAINETLDLPIDVLPYIHEHQPPASYPSLTGKQRKEILPQHWMPLHNENPDFKPEGGESFVEIMKRVQELRKYLEQHISEKNILVVTHGHFIRFFLGMVMYGNRFQPKDFGELSKSVKTSHTGITIFEYSDENKGNWPKHGWRLLTWMDHAHL